MNNLNSFFHQPNATKVVAGLLRNQTSRIQVMLLLPANRRHLIVILLLITSPFEKVSLTRQTNLCQNNASVYCFDKVIQDHPRSPR